MIRLYSANGKPINRLSSFVRWADKERVVRYMQPKSDIMPSHPYRTWPAILSLYLLSPLIAETIATSNTPPLAYLEPGKAFFLPAFYGSAAVLLHEIMKRKLLGWPSFLLMAGAFGIVNEAVIAGTWYTVKPQGYVFIDGIDWGWAASLTAFHIVFSMAIPIVLVQAMYPRVAQQPWLGKKGFRAFGTLFLLTSSLGLILRTYHNQRLLFLILAIVLTGIAPLLPIRISGSIQNRSTQKPSSPKLWMLRILGFGGTIGFFLLIYLLPAIFYPPPLVMFLYMGIFVFGATILFRSFQRYANWGPLQIFAILTGVGICDLLLSFLRWQAGQPIIVALSLLGLLILSRRARRQAMIPVTSNPVTIATEG